MFGIKFLCQRGALQKEDILARPSKITEMPIEDILFGQVSISSLGEVSNFWKPASASIFQMRLS